MMLSPSALCTVLLMVFCVHLSMSIEILGQDDDVLVFDDDLELDSCVDLWSGCPAYAPLYCSQLMTTCPKSCNACSGNLFPQKMDLSAEECRRLEYDVGTSVSQVMVNTYYNTEYCSRRFPEEHVGQVMYGRCLTSNGAARVFWKGDMIQHVAIWEPYNSAFNDPRCLDASLPRDGGRADASYDRYKQHLFGICDASKPTQHWVLDGTTLKTKDGRYCFSHKYNLVTIVGGDTRNCAVTSFRETEGVFVFAATGECIKNMPTATYSDGSSRKMVATEEKCHYDSMRFQPVQGGSLKSYQGNELAVSADGKLEGCRQSEGNCRDPAVITYDKDKKTMAIARKSAPWKALGCLDTYKTTYTEEAVLAPCVANKPSQMWFTKEAGCITKFCKRFSVDPSTVCNQSVDCIALALKQFQSDSCYQEVLSVLSALTNCKCPHLTSRIETAMRAQASLDDTLEEVDTPGDLSPEAALQEGKGAC